MTRSLPLLLTLLGCSSTPDKAHDPSSEASDTSAPADSGSDTGDGQDSNDPGPTTVSLAGQVEVPESTVLTGPLAVSVVHLTWNEGAVTLGLSLDSVRIDGVGGFSLSLPDPPPDSHLSQLSPSDHPEVVGAMYALPVFVPDDPVAPVFYEGQVIRGLPFDRFAVWLEPSSVGEAGWPGGWSLVDSGMAGSYAPPFCHLGSSQPLTWRWADGYPLFYSLDSLLSVRLRGLRASLELGGTVEGAVAGADRLAAIPQQVASGEDTRLSPVADMSLADGSFAELLTDVPGPDYDSSGDPDWRFSMSLLLRYVDDGDGSWTLAADGAQTSLQTACDGRRPAYLRYTREVNTWMGVRLLDCYEGQVGWRLVTLNETTRAYTYLSDADSQRLTVSDDCSF